MSLREREDRPPDHPTSSWEAFYLNYRQPGYVEGFEIQHKLGGGVFGIVYKARKISINKAYAIKFLRVEDPGARSQVIKELESVPVFAQVDHPNLVSIEDRGVVDGIPYIVMGYAGEETLESRLEDRRLSEEETLGVFVQALRGVQALHRHSLVHFDLKPANVFLKGDIARVGDYGLSKLISQSMLSLTTGRGTPYYMAPEMLHRKGDHRSDIYSLGVILYECISGEVPFTGDSEWEVLKRHEEGKVAYPATISRRQQRVIGRMLAKRPADRYQSIDEVLVDLRVPGTSAASILYECAGTGARTAAPSPPPLPSSARSPLPPPLPAVGAVRARRLRVSRRAKGRSSTFFWVVILLLTIFLAFVLGYAGSQGSGAWVRQWSTWPPIETRR